MSVNRPTPLWRDPIVIGGLAAFLGIVGLVTRKPAGSGPAVALTTGDLRAMHAGVTVGDHEVRGDARLVDGDTVKTATDGRARVRLDDGTLIVVDGSSELSLQGSRVTLRRGRLFVQGSAASHADVAVGGATTTVSSSAAAFDAAGGGVAKVYCARGELTVSLGGRQAHVGSGETASLEAAGPRVEPEKAFDDWTGGLAVPWSGDSGHASAIPALWGGATGEDPGSALVVHRARVDVDLEGEVAVTRTRTSYFNGSDRDLPAEESVSRCRRAQSCRASRGPIRASPRSTPRCVPRRTRTTIARRASSGPAAAGCAVSCRTSPRARRSTCSSTTSSGSRSAAGTPLTGSRWPGRESHR